MKAFFSRLEDGETDAAAGTVLDDALKVQCGDGRSIRLLKLQKPGAKAMDAPDFLRGLAIPQGALFT